MSSYAESLAAMRGQLERIDALAPLLRALADTPTWFFTLAVIYLLAYLVFGGERAAAGFASLKYVRHGSKQMFSKDEGTPTFFIFQPWFVNTSHHRAEGVSAQADFWGMDSKTVRHAFCTWAIAPDRDAPLETTFTAVKSNIDMAPSQIPNKLNLAVRFPGDPLLHVFTRESLNSPAGLRNDTYALDGNLVLVRLRLAGAQADQTFWFMLINDQAPGLRSLWAPTAWVFRGLFFLLRAWSRRRSTQPASSSAVTSADPLPTTETPTPPLPTAEAPLTAPAVRTGTPQA